MSILTLPEALETITALAKHVDFDRLPQKLKWDIENAEAVSDDDLQKIYLNVSVNGDPAPFWNTISSSDHMFQTIWEDEILKPCAETIRDRIRDIKDKSGAVDQIKEQMATMGVTLGDLK